METKIPIILALDAEPDEHFIDRGRRDDWKGFEAMVSPAERLRERISEATGTAAVFTWNWRLDPQVKETYGDPAWGLERYATAIEGHERHGDELGIHTHAYRWSAADNTWIVDYGNQPWVETCLGTGIGAYERALGRKPRTSSIGNSWLNSETVALLDRFEIRHELTIEPKLEGRAFPVGLGRFTGAVSDLSAVPRTPYQPADGDFRSPGPRRNDGIWMIPLSTGRCAYGPGTPAGLKRRLPELLRRRTALSRFHLGLGPGQFRGAFEETLREAEQPYFSLAVRSSLALHGNALRRLHRSLDFILGHRLAKRFVFCTPGRALELLGLTPKV